MGKKGDKASIKVDKLLRQTGVKLDRKLEKKIRKVGDRAFAAVNSAEGQKAIAAGLAMAASVAAARAAAPRSPEAPVPPVPPAPPVPPEPPVPPQGHAPRHEGEALPPELGKVVDAMSAAAGAFMNGLFGRKA